MPTPSKILSKFLAALFINEASGATHLALAIAQKVRRTYLALSPRRDQFPLLTFQIQTQNSRLTLLNLITLSQVCLESVRL